VELIQEIGSYAGFAAVIGLAVLSALYFSQARDVRRLRDWAGRAPERDAEARSRVAAAGQARVSTPAQQQPAAVGSGNNVGAATPAGTAAKAGAAVGAGAAGSQPLRGGPPARPGVPTGAAAAARGGSSGQHTQVLGASSNGGGPHGERWYRRLDARYIVLIVAGVLVVGGGIAFGATQLLSSDSGGGGGSGTSAGQGDKLDDEKAAEEKPKAPAIKPADVKVAVFNGTLTTGLGKETGDKLLSLGFAEPLVNQAPEEGFKAESVVFYANGKKREARFVAKKLKISNIEPIDELFAGLVTDEDVVVVIGQNSVQ
jgi:hypothetical protein